MISFELSPCGIWFEFSRYVSLYLYLQAYLEIANKFRYLRNPITSGGEVGKNIRSRTAKACAGFANP